MRSAGEHKFLASSGLHGKLAWSDIRTIYGDATTGGCGHFSGVDPCADRRITVFVIGSSNREVRGLIYEPLVRLSIVGGDMRRRTGTQIGGLILGIVLLVGGAVCLVYPTGGVIFHQEYDPNVSHPEYVTASQMRVYGGGGVALGVCLVWFSGGPWGRRRAAVEDYVWRLSQDLNRRFGSSKYYTVEQVTRAAEASGATKV